MASLVCFDYPASRLRFAFLLIRGALELNRKNPALGSFKSHH